jgi:hypothetical protein
VFSHLFRVGPLLGIISLLLLIISFVPAGSGAFISQLRVWPFSSPLVAASGERSQNPSNCLAGEKGNTK